MRFEIFWKYCIIDIGKIKSSPLYILQGKSLYIKYMADTGEYMRFDSIGNIVKFNPCILYRENPFIKHMADTRGHM